MFHVTVWTDFGVISTRTHETLNAAHAHGIDAINNLGCTRYMIKHHHLPGTGGWETLFDSAAYQAEVKQRMSNRR